MLIRHTMCITLWVSLVPNDSTEIIRFAENLCTYFLQICNFVFIHIDENDTIICKQIPS